MATRILAPAAACRRGTLPRRRSPEAALPEGFGLPALFAVTLFLSAALLFLVQPLIARMVLPLLGGAPAVWNTCMVFFQAMLLAGYLYAHATTSWLSPRRQALVHGALLLLPLLSLPIGLRAGWAPA